MGADRWRRVITFDDVGHATSRRRRMYPDAEDRHIRVRVASLTLGCKASEPRLQRPEHSQDLLLFTEVDAFEVLSSLLAEAVLGPREVTAFFLVCVVLHQGDESLNARLPCRVAKPAHFQLFDRLSISVASRL